MANSRGHSPHLQRRVSGSAAGVSSRVVVVVVAAAVVVVVAVVVMVFVVDIVVGLSPAEMGWTVVPASVSAGGRVCEGIGVVGRKC